MRIIFVFVVLMLLGTSIGFHTLWARRTEPHIREQIEALKSIMRPPYDITILILALLADAFLIVSIILFIRDW